MMDADFLHGSSKSVEVALKLPPAFQAGCRGFEPRLPLFAVIRLFASASNAT